MSATGPRLLDTTWVREPRGNLVAIEGLRDVPFAIARTFIVSGVPAGESRGIHAHHRCEQFLVCLAGSVRALADTGHRREEFLLDNPGRGLYLPALTWGTQFDYSADAVLLVLASAAYDPDDYIHDYDEFLTEIASRS